jgi:zinc/manganese transport system substrate-binding protein
MVFPRPALRVLSALAVLVVGAAIVAGCGSGEAGGAAAGTDASAAAGSTSRPTIVVTYSVLGSLVSELVGDAADVHVLMPNGVDPHDWQPSAKDVEAVNEADLVVANGLHLEESLEETLEQAASAGVPVFVASDHVEVRRIGEGEVGETHAEGEEHAEDGGDAGEADHGGEEGEEHGPGAEDPHIWMDPLAMKAVVAALATTLGQELGLRLGQRAAELEARLDELNAEIANRLSVVPPDRRKLVTGHESMGYFADRYGFELIGAVIPSISSQAEASAAELSELREKIEQAGVPAIFTEIGTPTQVAEAIASEAGVEVVELPSHNLPQDGSYLTFMRDIADRIATALRDS